MIYKGQLIENEKYVTRTLELKTIRDGTEYKPNYTLSEIEEIAENMRQVEAKLRLDKIEWYNMHVCFTNDYDNDESLVSLEWGEKETEFEREKRILSRKEEIDKKVFRDEEKKKIEIEEAKAILRKQGYTIS